ncbi:MAG TPA: hypothetical protein VM121_08490 [Acidimicrobiales bacterium]|nr:hypothetical protein [Acidimicrobiales bacterium]
MNDSHSEKKANGSTRWAVVASLIVNVGGLGALALTNVLSTCGCTRRSAERVDRAAVILSSPFAVAVRRLLPPSDVRATVR